MTSVASSSSSPSQPSNAGISVTQDDNAITDHLDDEVSIDSLIVRPNIVDDVHLSRNIMNAVNTHGIAASRSGLGTTVIEPGEIGIILHNGRVEVACDGRWMKLNPRSSWIGARELTQNPIQYETLTIVRVRKGQYGLATENGRSVILDEGVHVRNTRLFSHNNFADVNQKHICHGTINIIRVPAGEYALVTVRGVPKVLRTGSYVLDSNYFKVIGFSDVNLEHTQHMTIHIIRVSKGRVALITNNNKPILLSEGTYTFNSQVFSYNGSRGVNEPSIVHGTITRFRVRNGEIGLAWEDNRPVFIEVPDFYERDSPSFTFVQCVSASEKQIVLGSRKRIVVYDGEVGISYLNGKLEILQPMTHVFDAVDRLFMGFLSTRQQSLMLLEPGSKSSLLDCDTKDFVEVGIKAAVFYRICDPERALLTIGGEEAIAKLIRETSIATLQGIMRSTALNQVAQSRTVHAADEVAAGKKASAAPVFFDKVHDEFIFRLHDNFVRMYGVDISNIRIESFKIMDAELADNISKQAIITAQTETKLANLEGQREIATAEMERDSAVTRIKTQAAAAQLATEAQARNTSSITEAEGVAQSKIIIARGEADALIIRAQAQAQAQASAAEKVAQGEAAALLTKAEAQAKAIELKAAAEKKRAQELSSVPLGSQLAVLSIQSDTVIDSMEGVQKVIYMSSGSNMASTPLQLFGMNGMDEEAQTGTRRRAA